MRESESCVHNVARVSFTTGGGGGGGQNAT